MKNAIVACIAIAFVAFVVAPVASQIVDAINVLKGV